MRGEGKFMSKCVLYPYDISLLHMVLHDFDNVSVKEIASPNGWGYVGEDAGDKIGIQAGIIVKDKQDICWKQIDKLLLMPSILPLDERELQDVVELAASFQVEVVDMRVPKERVLLKSETDTPESELKEIDLPIVLVIGTGERTNKFDIQLAIRDCFKQNGYHVSQIGTKGYCEYLDFHSFPEFMYGGQPVTEGIIKFNHYVHEIANTEEADVIVIGVPGGLVPYNEKYLNDFGYLNFMVANAVKPDYVVLATVCVDYNSEYINSVTNVLQYKYEYDVDAVFISNSCINWEVTKSIDRLTHVTLDVEYVKKEAEKANVYSVYEKSHVEQFKKHLLGTLSGYGEYSTL